MKNGIWPCLTSSPSLHTPIEVTSPAGGPNTPPKELCDQTADLDGPNSATWWWAMGTRSLQQPHRGACRDSTMWPLSSYCTSGAPAHIISDLLSQIPKAAAAFSFQEAQEATRRPHVLLLQVSAPPKTHLPLHSLPITSFVISVYFFLPNESLIWQRCFLFFPLLTS